ncbi:MAG: response regulator transcription factor [Anaerolineae bacterium]|nr:response regulator transcription factor [Anaerolineae bacterium]
MATIYLLEAHHRARDGLKILLETESDLQLVGESAQAAGIIHHLERLQPDLLIAGLTMDALELEMIREITARRLKTRVIVLSLSADEQLIKRALDHGVAGFVLKEHGGSAVSAAIRSVLAGRIYIQFTERTEEFHDGDGSKSSIGYDPAQKASPYH